MSTTLRKQRSESWDILETKLEFVERQIKNLREKLANLRRCRSFATAENRDFYRGEISDVMKTAASVLGRWEALCALYDLIGDTKERAW